KLLDQLRQVKEPSEEAGDHATNGLVDDWIDQAEERAWFLSELLKHRWAPVTFARDRARPSRHGQAMAQVQIIDDAGDAQIAEWLFARLDAALARTVGGIAITVPGGSTPFPILAALVERHLDWRRLSVWPGDDRLVSEDHPA